MNSSQAAHTTRVNETHEEVTCFGKYWWATESKRRRLAEEGIFKILEERRLLRDKRNGTTSEITPTRNDTSQPLGETPEVKGLEEDKYKVTIMSSMIGE